MSLLDRLLPGNYLSNVQATFRPKRYDFTEDDHNDLYEIILELDEIGAKFMISYDDKPAIIELYNKFTITKIPVIYAGQVHDRKPKNEVVVTNYAPENKQLTIL